MGFFKDLIQRLRGKDNESRVRRLDQRVDELKSQARSFEDKAKNISTNPCLVALRHKRCGMP